MQKKYPDYDPDKSEITFELIQQYRSLLSDHFKDYKLNEIEKFNKNILSVLFDKFKLDGGKIKEEQFIYELLSSLKEAHSHIFHFLIKESSKD